VEIYIEGFQTMAEAFIDVGLRSRMLETLKALSQVAEKSGYGRADISAVTASVLAEGTTPDRP
jgi:hypothetical protein